MDKAYDYIPDEIILMQKITKKIIMKQNNIQKIIFYIKKYIKI